MRIVNSACSWVLKDRDSVSEVDAVPSQIGSSFLGIQLEGHRAMYVQSYIRACTGPRLGNFTGNAAPGCRSGIGSPRAPSRLPMRTAPPCLPVGFAGQRRSAYRSARTRFQLRRPSASEVSSAASQSWPARRTTIQRSNISRSTPSTLSRIEDGRPPRRRMRRSRSTVRI